MTGHKTGSVFERYNIVSPGDLLETARKLDAAMGLNPVTGMNPGECIELGHPPYRKLC